MNLNRVLIVALLLLLFPSVAAQADKVDEFITSEMKNRRIPGLALAVVKNGEVIKAKGYGLANLELNVPVTLDSVFDLASITKPFTATAIMLLVEEGKVLSRMFGVLREVVGAPVGEALKFAPAEGEVVLDVRRPF